VSQVLVTGSTNSARRQISLSSYVVTLTKSASLESFFKSVRYILFRIASYGNTAKFG
jgi:hypothetical protein